LSFTGTQTGMNPRQERKDNWLPDGVSTKTRCDPGEAKASKGRIYCQRGGGYLVEEVVRFPHVRSELSLLAPKVSRKSGGLGRFRLEIPEKRKKVWKSGAKEKGNAELRSPSLTENNSVELQGKKTSSRRKDVGGAAKS